MPNAQRFEGNYSDYHETQLSQNKSFEEKETKPNVDTRVRDRQKKGMSFKERKEFEELNITIENLEEEKALLEDFFSSGAIDTSGEKQKRYKEIEELLQKHYMRWEELAELEQ